MFKEFPISILLGIIGVFLILAVLWDGFETMILPRQVMRRLRITRLFYRSTWLPWSWFARAAFAGKRLEPLLSTYGPLSLLLLIGVWAGVLIFGFALLHWALGPGLSVVDHAGGFMTDLYLSGTTFFTLGLGDVRPVTLFARIITVIEAGMGFAFLALVIGYLPALTQSFSRREASISMLDARAGSPPTAGRMLQKCCHDGKTEYLRQQLQDYERWCAELMESHLSYPVLAYYRSQHENQSWLAALTAILDTSAIMLVAFDNVLTLQAELTFAIARHATVDLAAVFGQPPRTADRDRMGVEDLNRLHSLLESMGSNLSVDDLNRKLRKLRRLYEPYIHSLAGFFCFSVPPWVPRSDEQADWQKSLWDEESEVDENPDSIHAEWREHHFRK